MDLLDFEAEGLYFDDPIQPEALGCIEQASQRYGDTGSEELLLRAYFLEPEHLLVLVALYRYFYFRHRLEEALLVAERVLKVTALRLGLPANWKDLSQVQLGEGVMVSMTLLRFYMLALKGAGFLELRLGRFESALERLQKVAALDSGDRLGTAVLIDMARAELSKSAGSSAAHI